MPTSTEAAPRPEAITSTTWDDETWPIVKVELARAFRMGALEDPGGGEAGGVVELRGASHL